MACIRVSQDEISIILKMLLQETIQSEIKVKNIEPSRDGLKCSIIVHNIPLQITLSYLKFENSAIWFIVRDLFPLAMIHIAKMMRKLVLPQGITFYGDKVEVSVNSIIKSLPYLGVITIENVNYENGFYTIETCFASQTEQENIDNGFSYKETNNNVTKTINGFCPMCDKPTTFIRGIHGEYICVYCKGAFAKCRSIGCNIMIKGNSMRYCQQCYDRKEKNRDRAAKVIGDAFRDVLDKVEERFTGKEFTTDVDVNEKSS